MTATIDYHSFVHPMAETILSGPDEHGKCSVRVPFNSSIAVTYGDPRDIDQQIRTLQAARDALADHQGAVDAARRTRAGAA